MIAVLGTGSIGMKHLTVLQSLGVDGIAVPVREARCNELARAGFRTARTLLEAKQEGARAVIIATATARHCRDLTDALSLELPILCEKPLAVRSGELELVSQEVERTSARVFVAYCLRFDGGIQQAKRLLPELGTIHSARIECRSYLPQWRPAQSYQTSYSADPLQGGVLRDLSHEVDYAALLFGKPKRVSGVLSTTGRLSIGSEELAEAVWQMANGALVSIGLDYLSHEAIRMLRVQGAEGSIECDLIARKFRKCRNDHKETIMPLQPDREAMYKEQMIDFLGVVNGSPTSQLATFEDGCEVLHICDAWRRSSELGQAEVVE